MTPEDLYSAGRAVAQTLLTLVDRTAFQDELDYSRAGLVGAAMIASITAEAVTPHDASNEQCLAERTLFRKAISLAATTRGHGLDLFMHGFVPAEGDDAQATLNLAMASMGGAGDNRRSAAIRALAAAYVLCSADDISLLDLLPIAAETAGRADRLLETPEDDYPETTSPGGDA